MNARDADRFPPPSTRKLMRRLWEQSRYASGIVLGSLAFGMGGYHWVAKLGWDEAFENTAMLLGGMGQVGDMPNVAGRVFAGVFSLYSGLVFLAVTALVLAPVFHHVLHRFHWEKSQADS